MSRPARSLEPDLLGRAFQKHFSLALRSERLDTFADVFVDNRQTEVLNGGDWQVVFGRRGTGKTLLLGVLHERSEAEVEDSRILSVWLNAQDFVVSPLGRVVPDRARAAGFFHVFLEQLTNQLAEKVDRLLSKPRFLDRLTGERRARVSEAETLLLEIMSITQEGKAIGLRAESYETTVERREMRSTDEKARAGAGFSISPIGATAKLSAGYDAVLVQKDESRAREQFETIVAPRLSDARRRIVDLLKILGIKRLNILIDEWCALDPSASTAIQPEFAELMKRAFAGTPLISVKVATTRYQTKFSNKGARPDYRGLELGADMFEATNLDRALMEIDRHQFYASLLFKRLRYCEPELATFDPRGEGRPDSAFITSIFKQPRAFEDLVAAAEGIPREFLQIFNELARRKNFSVEPLWEATDVQRCIRERSVSNLNQFVDYQSESDQVLSKCVKRVVQKTASRMFIAPKRDPLLDRALEDLLEKRLIHEVARERLTYDLPERVDVFLVDFGLWLEWTKQSFSSLTGLPVPPPPADWRELRIDGTLVQRDNMIKCCNCNMTFPRDSKSYVVRGLCPECFTAAD